MFSHFLFKSFPGFIHCHTYIILILSSSTGGVGAPRQEDFIKRFGNPTILGLACFLLCLSPLSCYNMSFRGTNGATTPVLLVGTLVSSFSLLTYRYYYLILTLILPHRFDCVALVVHRWYRHVGRCAP